MTPTPNMTPGERRAVLRADPGLARAIEHHAALQPGGSIERPVEVKSASVVDIRAESTPCPLCHGALRRHDDEVRWYRGRPVRLVRLRCTMCGSPRTLHYVVRSADA